MYLGNDERNNEGKRGNIRSARPEKGGESANQVAAVQAANRLRRCLACAWRDEKCRNFCLTCQCEKWNNAVIKISM